MQKRIRVLVAAWLMCGCAASGDNGAALGPPDASPSIDATPTSDVDYRPGDSGIGITDTAPLDAGAADVVQDSWTAPEAAPDVTDTGAPEASSPVDAAPTTCDIIPNTADAIAAEPPGQPFCTEQSPWVCSGGHRLNCSRNPGPPCPVCDQNDCCAY